MYALTWKSCTLQSKNNQECIAAIQRTDNSFVRNNGKYSPPMAQVRTTGNRKI